MTFAFCEISPRARWHNSRNIGRLLGGGVTIKLMFYVTVVYAYKKLYTLSEKLGFPNYKNFLVSRVSRRNFGMCIFLWVGLLLYFKEASRIGESGANWHPFFLLASSKVMLTAIEGCNMFAWELCIKALHIHIFRTPGTLLFVLLKKIKFTIGWGELAQLGWIGTPGGVNWHLPKIQSNTAIYTKCWMKMCVGTQ